MRRIIFFGIIFVYLFTSTVALAENGKIYFKGPTTDIAPDSEFNVSIFLDASSPINALDLEINYPKNQLKFLDFDNTDSIVDIWQTKPTVLPNGNIGLSGGIIQAFKGTSGLIGKISFKALNTGTQKISFQKADVYLADGNGTKGELILGTTTFSIKEDAKVISTPIVPFQSTPEDVEINQGLEEYKREVETKKIFIPILVFIVFVIGALLVYNKRRRNSIR